MYFHFGSNIVQNKDFFILIFVKWSQHIKPLCSTEHQLVAFSNQTLFCWLLKDNALFSIEWKEVALVSLYRLRWNWILKKRQILLRDTDEMNIYLFVGFKPWVWRQTLQRFLLEPNITKLYRRSSVYMFISTHFTSVSSEKWY